MTDENAQFLKERDEALLSMDLVKINAMTKKFSGPVLLDDEVGWCAIHKARTAITNFPADEKQKSKAWLAAHGYEPWGDASDIPGQAKGDG